MRAIQRLLLPLMAAASVAAARPSTSVPPVNQPLVGPEAALERYAEAFRDRSPDSVGAVLTADYRFHTAGDSLSQLEVGSDRASEMRLVRNLLLGIVRDGVTVVPPPDSVGMRFDGIAEGVDPEHPDSTQHYRTLTVNRAEYGIRTHTGDRLLNAPTTHAFQVVRGDAALLVPGQVPSAEIWYIRRWIEDVSGIRAALDQREGGCGEAPAPVPGPRSGGGRSPAVPTVLAVHALTNPACSKLEVTCDLPGPEQARVEVYDVSGRRVNHRDVTVAAAGTMTIEAGRGASLNPGVYWVRVGQGLRTPVTRMVVVAR